MATARYSHTATLLPSGKGLVAGGFSAPDFLASAELYDPATGTWSAPGSMETGRESHTATLLPSGRVLVAGGLGAVTAFASAELYDPAAGTWSATGTMETSRSFHTATLLPSGKVLVAGGLDAAQLASAELYDPTVLISPASLTAAPKASQAFTASGGSGTGYTWTFVTNASGGTLSTTGAYTAGSTGGVTDVVGVTDSLGNSATASIAVTASPAPGNPPAPGNSGGGGGCGVGGGETFPLLALALLGFLTSRRRPA